MFDTDKYTEQFVLFTCEECGLETDINKHEVGGRTLCKTCYKEVIERENGGYEIRRRVNRTDEYLRGEG